MIYKAFRTFVTSKKYRKVYWQKDSFEETLVDGYGSLEKALNFAMYFRKKTKSKRTPF